MASPVFGAMLVGKFIEAQKNEIELEDDDPDAMLIILRIAHLRGEADLSSTLSNSQRSHDMRQIRYGGCLPTVRSWLG
jgi:hypothetical protein